MSKVTLSGHILVPEPELAAVRDALPAHIDATKAESGCLVFSVTENTSEPGRFEVYEEFDSKEAFEHHQKRASESDWGQIAKNVARNYTVTGLEN